MQNKAGKGGNTSSNTNKNFLNKKIVVLCSIAVAVIAVAAAVIAAAVAKPAISDNEPVAYVAQYPIYAGELRLAVEAVRSDTVMYFIDTYDAVQGKEFWESEYGGESPREKLIAAALEKAAGYKREQIMMLDYGIIKQGDMEYKSFYSEFIAENRDRAKSKENGEIIYGPAQYTEQGFYDYLHNNRLLELCWAVNEKITGDTSLAYDKENYEQQFAKHYAALTVTRDDAAIAKLTIEP